MLRKWFCILLMLGFGFTNAYSSDDDEEDYDDEDYDEEEEILPATKKLNTKSAQKAKKEGVEDSKVGLSAGFDGSPLISLVYNIGSGIELGLGFGLYREQYTPNGQDAISLQEWRIVLDFSYELGKGLLNYGLGAQGIILSSNFDINYPDGLMNKGLLPYFYVSGELIKNVSLFLKAGPFVYLLADGPAGPDGLPSTTGNMNITIQSSVGLTFYFI